MTIFILVLIITAGGIIYAAYNLVKVRGLSEGTLPMSEIASAIRIGANTFLAEEYKVLIYVVLAITAFIGVFLEFSAAVSFLIGVTMSGLAGYLGMKASTYANVRVANKARETKNIGKTLKVALRGGSVSGLSVSCFALIGLTIVYFLFHGQLHDIGTIRNWIGLEFEPFSMSLFSYALGCSVLAMFNRVGGGIFTKCADMGADLVGKGEENIPEDDPRNPAVIADCVGDNVGDTAGLGSDLLESYMGAVSSGMVFIVFLYRKYAALGLNFSRTLFDKLFLYPVIFVIIGLVACILSLMYVFLKKDGKDPHRELNIATWFAAGFTAVGNLVATYFLFNGESFGDLPFKLGMFSPYISALTGIVSGILIGIIAEYYTSYDYKPTQTIAESSLEGPAITITQGISVGMKSTLLTVTVLGGALILSTFISGAFGAAMAAIGMLSFVSVTVSVDTYGPISDNAGGIAEMCDLGDDVRQITDKLDSVGNTTAAIGKGFAIGSAAFAAVALLISYMYSFTPIELDVVSDILNPLSMAGAMVGGGLSFFFSGLLIGAVSKSAKKMVSEVRRQFREIVGLREGKVKPDYKQCITIATQGALSEMKAPALIAILVPVAGGFILGPNFVAGILFGSTLCSIMLAIFFGNAGGAWDNAKKLIESKGLKGTLQHLAAIIGDTIGDPFKDTAGPSLDILIKIMSTVSLIMVPIYSQYNLLSLLSHLFG